MDAETSLLPVQGGPVVTILIILSVVATTFILAKVWQFIRLGSGGQKKSEQALALLEKGDVAQTLIMSRNQKSPSLSLIAHVTELRQKQMPEDVLKEESMRTARVSLVNLGKGLRPIEVIANVAPLIGLFGTVLGMIEAFQAMESAGSQVDPAVLSGGIWQALLTTAAGLAVAIPVSMIHSALERKVEMEGANLQNVHDRLFVIGHQKPQLKAAATGTAK